MHEIFHAKNVVFSELLLDDRIVGDGDTLLVNLAVSAFVDQFTN